MSIVFLWRLFAFRRGTCPPSPVELGNDKLALQRTFLPRLSRYPASSVFEAVVVVDSGHLRITTAFHFPLNGAGTWRGDRGEFHFPEREWTKMLLRTLYSLPSWQLRQTSVEQSGRAVQGIPVAGRNPASSKYSLLVTWPTLFGGVLPPARFPCTVARSLLAYEYRGYYYYQVRIALWCLCVACLPEVLCEVHLYVI